jgi:hypothetical protein
MAGLSDVVKKNDYIESVHKLRFSVIPTEAGIQNPLNLLDSRLHGNDKKQFINRHYIMTITTFKA